MADLDAELAALEAEVENESKQEKKQKEVTKSNHSNKSNNYSNNNPKTQPKPQPQPKKNNNYEEYGNPEQGLEDFLNSDDTNNQNNNNYNNYSQKSNYYNNNNNNNNFNQYKSNVQNNPQNYSHASNISKNQNQHPNQYNYNSPHTQVKQKQNINQPKIENKNSSQTQVISRSKEHTQEPKEDIYPVKQENMYHKVKEMNSLKVLEEEIVLCDKIIAFKKKKGLECDNWETKKETAKKKLSANKSLIESGSMDFEKYKKLILAELAYEKKILSFTESDKVSKPYELAEIKRRIEQRINVINKELTQNKSQEIKQEPKNQEQNNPQKSKIQPMDNQGNKTVVNPKISPPQNIPLDSDPSAKATTQVISNNNKIRINLNDVPKQYIIQQKVLTTDPKTGKQMYVMKNVVDPKYEKILKQKALQANQNKPVTDNKNPQHIIQQKVLVTDPKTGKQMYVMKNVVDPKYAHQPNNNINNLEQAQNKNKAQTVVNNPKNESSEEIKKYQLYINTLIKEYTEAKEYFKRNNQESLANKARQDLRTLMAAKQKVDMGRYKEVKLNLLPKTITPEYIFGYSEAEKTNKFKLIFTQFIKDKNDLEEKMKSILEKMKKLKKKEFEKAKDAVKPKLDEMKLKKDNITKLIEVLKEKFKDKWTPAPEYTKIMEEEKVEKTSFEGAIFGLKIKVGKTDYDKDKTYLNLKLEVKKDKTLTRQVHLKQVGDYNEEWKWEFSGDEFKNISKGFLYIELFRQHIFSDDKKGEGKIDLGKIKSGAPFKVDCKIEIESKRVEPSISFLISPVMPQGKKYYESVQKEKIKITKIYNAFTGKQQISLPSNKPQTQNPQPKTVVASNPNPDPNQNQKKATNNTNTNNNTNANNMPKIDKSKFKPEELEDVDYIDNLNTLKVLEFKIKELEGKIKKIDGRTPKEMLQKKVRMNCKKRQIEEEMGDGTVSPKDYMEMMKVQLEHDQLLSIYMKQNNQEENVKILSVRIALIKKEMEELKQFVK